MTDAGLANLIALHSAGSFFGLGAAFAAARLQPRPFWKWFWFAIGGSSFILGLAGIAAILTLPPNPRPLLRFHAAFTGLALAAGAILGTRPAPGGSGIGLAVVIQSLEQLLLNLAAWRLCE